MFVGPFCPPGSGSGYRSRNPIESGFNPDPDKDPDPQYCPFVILCVWCEGGRACLWTSWACPATSPSHSQRRISALVSGRQRISQCLFLRIFYLNFFHFCTGSIFWSETDIFTLLYLWSWSSLCRVIPLNYTAIKTLLSKLLLQIIILDTMFSEEFTSMVTHDTVNWNFSHLVWFALFPTPPRSSPWLANLPPPPQVLLRDSIAGNEFSLTR